MDHITPSLWEGDVDVGRVVLLTAWQDSATCVCSVDTELRSLYDALPKDGLVNILSPLGELVIKINSMDGLQTDKLEMEDGENVGDATATAICQPHINAASTDMGGPVTNEANLDPNHGLDLEDIINTVEDDGAQQKVGKSRRSIKCGPSRYCLRILSMGRAHWINVNVSKDSPGFLSQIQRC